MPDILIRNLSKQTVETLKQRAARHGRSLQQELARALEQIAEEPGLDTFQQAQAFKERLRASGRTFSDSTELIREDRDR